MSVHIYKLSTGETIIAHFIGVETLNEVKNIVAHVVRDPVVVNRHEELFPWVNGFKSMDQIYIPKKFIIFGGDQNRISPSLLEHYLTVFPK